VVGDRIFSQVKTGKAKVVPEDQERAALMQKVGVQIARFHRIRFLARRPFAYELVCPPVQHFAGFALRPEIPNEPEELAQGSGLLVARVEAKIRAMPCPPTTTTALA
jgi:DNA-binding GntR family transcriptional regulator